MLKKFGWAAAAVCAGALVLTFGCSNAFRSSIAAWGEPAVIVQYSGGKVVYAGISTGKIENEEHSDGYYFQDKCRGNHLVRISGPATVFYPDPMPRCDQLPKPLYDPTVTVRVPAP